MRKKGFTLIELLIVVAIIAILAAIAVPNFLEAQTRSKVSRVKADQRSVATAIEAYCVEWNSYPMDSKDFGPDDGGVDFTWWTDMGSITTPVAFITSMIKDPFWTDGPDVYEQYATTTGGGSVTTTKAWLLASVGVDLDSADRGDVKERTHFYFAYPILTVLQTLQYDPTNGTISNGDIIRTSLLSY
jgi:prepilin-type N-terminal cleavage/methylation domain-containing protein